MPPRHFSFAVAHRSNFACQNFETPLPLVLGTHTHKQMAARVLTGVCISVEIMRWDIYLLT